MSTIQKTLFTLACILLILIVGLLVGCSGRDNVNDPNDVNDVTEETWRPGTWPGSSDWHIETFDGTVVNDANVDKVDIPEEWIIPKKFNEEESLPEVNEVVYMELKDFKYPYVMQISQSDFEKLSPDDQSYVVDEVTGTLKMVQEQVDGFFSDYKRFMESGEQMEAVVSLEQALMHTGILTGKRDDLHFSRSYGLSLQRDLLEESKKCLSVVTVFSDQEKQSMMDICNYKLDSIDRDLYTIESEAR